MEGSTLEEHSCVLNSIVGTDCSVGKWARVDGEPEPEQEIKGQISVTVLGESCWRILRRMLMASYRSQRGARSPREELYRPSQRESCIFTVVDALLTPRNL